MNEQELIEKLRKIQALYVGATTPGERIAAEKAYHRTRARLEQEQRLAVTEYKFTMGDSFQRRLFTALVRKHGLKPYRYPRQRYTTVMVDASPQFVDEVLWPEFQQLSEGLRSYLDQVTDRVIREAVHADQSDAAVAPALPGA